MASLRERLMSQPKGRPNPLAIPREMVQVSGAVFWHTAVGMPLEMAQAFLTEPALDGVFPESRFFDALGRRFLRLFDALGPIYGKAGQIALSRLSEPLHEIADTLRLTRLYKDWPPLPFSEVEAILDREIPRWRKHLQVTPHPLGVASLAQVHAAQDEQGREWVIKIIKPHAQRRLLQTVEALESAASAAEPFALTLLAKRSLRELRELCAGFRRELSLDRERETIERVAEKLKSKRQRILLIPAVNPEFCTPNVLTVERFQGVSLSSVVSGKVEVPAAIRQKLAKSMLSELLVQVFELGLFHADPHAGNLILLENGSVGLFDWGLAGELSDSDRRHIAAILRAVIALDLDLLVEALIIMGSEAGRELTPEAVQKELKVVTGLIKKGREDPNLKPSLQQLFEACLRGASKLGIDVPEGLLMMVKSLITIEGLAKGIDPAISMARVATPVLLKAARPGIKDLWAIGKRLPQVAKLVLGRA